VPFHGVPGRDAALRAGFAAAHRMGARIAVLLEADVVSTQPDWIPRLTRPILDDKADFVTPVYARHRYEGTITRLLLSPLVRALYGRRLHHPLGGQQALSGRLIEHLLLHPKWDWAGRDASDLWITGTAIADGFSVWETWLGPYAVKSATRTADLPAMIAQTLGATFSVMERHGDLWLEVRGSEPLPCLGEPAPAPPDVVTVDVERMLDAFHRGATDLSSIWELILAPDTLGSVLSLDVSDPRRFVFPDDLWARVVYDFALGHHYGVVHRDHLLRSLVPIYLGRTAAFVSATQGARAAAAETALEAVGEAFERQKPYLVEHWR
jgi:glucosylglycerate synthase